MCQDKSQTYGVHNVGIHHYVSDCTLQMLSSESIQRGDEVFQRIASVMSMHFKDIMVMALAKSVFEISKLPNISFFLQKKHNVMVYCVHDA